MFHPRTQQIKFTDYPPLFSFQWWEKWQVGFRADFAEKRRIISLFTSSKILYTVKSPVSDHPKWQA